MTGGGGGRGWSALRLAARVTSGKADELKTRSSH